jgi:DNA-binding GntR family transcriptional regulator
LQQEGLVRLERHRGAKVNRISREDVEELYELRVDLERLAAKRAARLATDDEFSEMGSVADAYGRAVDGGPVQEAVDLDIRFHDLIYRAARHTRLYSCWSNLLRSQIHAFILSSSLEDPSYMIPCVPRASGDTRRVGGPRPGESHKARRRSPQQRPRAHDADASRRG